MDSASTVTVMTFNVGNGLARARRLIPSLRASGADIIGLQELAAIQAEAIAAELATDYPYQELHPDGVEGKGALSRYPLADEGLLPLVNDRPDLRVTALIGGASLTLLVTHPAPPYHHWRDTHSKAAAHAQIAMLTGIALACPPAVLLGDFNMTKRHAHYAHLETAGLVDAFGVAGAGPQYTLPTRVGYSRRLKHSLRWARLIPVVRVDYIWLTADLAVESAWVGRDAGSDHLPVFARFSVPAARAIL
ncbi:MAG TPA: endonuclease/exonuclease/phosphatase family protein [Ktedonobacterales bacterium]